jgi:hypothetical protein
MKHFFLADGLNIDITCPSLMFVRMIADFSKYFVANIVKDITNIKKRQKRNQKRYEHY